MKKFSLILSFGFLGILAGFLIFSVVTTRAQDGEDDPRRTDLCTYTSENIYNNPDWGLEQVMEEYHEHMNNEFNRYIKVMITGQAEKEKQPPENSIPPELPENPEDTDSMKDFCDKNRDNYSTFCVAANLLSDTTNGNGYLQYAQALNCRRNDIFDSTKEKTLWEEYQNVTTCLAGVESVLPPDLCTREEEARLEKELQGVLQGQRVLVISARLDAIDREIAASKRALDQTLSAYNELKSAWPMHKRYIEVYEELVKYRDKMIEIRHQVEQYPSKFIDATTTACT